MFSWLMFWRRKTSPAEDSGRSPSVDYLAVKKRFEDYHQAQKKMSLQDAQRIVKDQFPGAEISSVGTHRNATTSGDVVFVLYGAKDKILSGWSRTEKSAWIEGALRIMGVSPFGSFWEK